MPTGAMRQARPETAPLAVSDAAQLAELGHRTSAALSRFLDESAPVLLGAGDELSPVLDAVRTLVLSGGKRLRPVFCYWGWRGAGAADDEGIVIAAASLELLHACALVHDDVMDDSQVRRGRPAAHRAFARLHEQAGWAGDARAFGTHAAILLGDLCLVWADAMLHGCGLEPKVLQAGAAVATDMRVQLLAGQYLDVTAGHAPAADRTSQALRIARYKTSVYTVVGPLRLGGTLAGASDQLLAAYEAYGLPLGEAFQLRDDLLGIYGDPAVTGKPAGDDLREGRRTAVVTLAEEYLAAPAREELIELVGSPALDDADVDRCRELIAGSGAVATVEAMIERRAGTAWAALEAAEHSGLEPAARAALEALITRLVQRAY